jgi:type IV secretory pathway TraG/TraD family ATPase VirD4
VSAFEASRGRAIEASRARAILTLARVAVAVALLGMGIGAMLVWLASGADERQLAAAWARHWLYQHVNPLGIFKAQQQGGFAAAIVSPEQVAAMRMLRHMLAGGGLIALPLAAGITMLVRRHWISAARAAALDHVLRGNRIATTQELAALVSRSKPQGQPLRIGGVPIPSRYDTRHALAAGTTGSGKTTMLQGHARQIEVRGECILIFDPDGSYTQHFYRPERGDVILNVWDVRSARWNPLTDITNLADAYRVASVLLPKPAQVAEAAVWYDQARSVLAHILDHQARVGDTSLDTLAATLNSATVDALSAIAAGTPAGRVFETGGERATASVLFMMGLAARTVSLLAVVPKSAPAFSFDRFYTSLDDHDGAKPFVFLAAPRRYREAAAPIIAAWIDAAASAILHREPGNGCNAWLFLDELASLPPIQSLLTLLPEGRKHRACVVIAFQSIAQLRQTYGNEGAEVITGQTAIQLIMAVGDSATAKWAVELVGTVEVEHQRASETLGPDKHGHGSLATHRERKSLVIDAELTGLNTGEAFLRLAGLPVAKVAIDAPTDLPVIASAFIPAPAPAPTVAAIVGDIFPAPCAASRIEDRDDWLTAGPF